MNGVVQLELWLHEYKMDALSSVLEKQGITIGPLCAVRSDKTASPPHPTDTPPWGAVWRSCTDAPSPKMHR